MVRTAAALQADFFFCPYRHSCLAALGAALVEPQRADGGLRGRETRSQFETSTQAAFTRFRAEEILRAVFVVASATAGNRFPKTIRDRLQDIGR